MIYLYVGCLYACTQPVEIVGAFVTVPPAPPTVPVTLSPPRAPTTTTITVVLPPPQQIETGEL